MNVVTIEEFCVEASAQPARIGLPPETRRDEVTQYVAKAQDVKVEELAERFGVSAMTIHRDLELLSRDGRLERVRGGARAITSRMAERDVRLRRHMNAAAKDALARAAAALIPAGAVVGLDDSTTVGAMGAYLAGRRPSTVITHSLPLMNIVACQPDIALVGLGGQYYTETDSFLGSVVVEQLHRITADVVFVSTTAVKNDALFHPDAEAALTKRAMIAMAARKVLLVDSSKFESTGLYHVMDVEGFDDVVIDDALPEHHRARLRELGVTIHVATAQ
ncbi:DeoR/GlpR family DNA-binding transcription regulator [Paeniglutamicibacter sulfureus]|uniref:Lactose phosphotransferase system repressor n=1 Tax=Paeniglutamicibacter sulfureus TaxID=43666 RepID=A0ABU2BIW6_9MICC|nr:DeoR/GlpR family DNA-binding transcription regulator [Paeniglutamicibacter sulfureus]MDO2933799.1 DeoR/GlpR family DNA-binding transcription regulator [Paeniglutamicibacter sulfureus]MDR7358236.1 DeoR/GlpR family transcriptional regulator of sugar metabolism [Paeniglutamicibacter sulfureus]